MTTKLCKDCQYLRRDWLIAIITIGIVSPYAFARCGRADSFMDDGRRYVDGRGTAFASSERAYSNRCGPDAKNFEPKS